MDTNYNSIYKLWRILDQAEFNTDKVNVSSMGNFPNHLNISSKNFNIVAFNSAEYATVLKNSNSQSITVELQLSEFKGKKYLKGIAKNIYTGTLTKPKNNDVLYGEYVLQLSHTVDN
jgi:hypothetical protein